MFKNVVIKNKKSSQRSISFLDFAFAEFSSAIEMLQAAKLTDNKKLALGFLNHSLDEFRHTDFFIKCLNNLKNVENIDRNLKFDSKLVYNLGFINKNYFLFNKYSLSQFCIFIMINESEALKLFTKIKKMNFIQDINDKKSLENIISEEKKHLAEAEENNLLIDQYSELLKDEQRHVTLSDNFSKKQNKLYSYRLLSLKFLIANKFRHFVSKNIYINSIINLVISLFIIFLSYPLKLALRFKEPSKKYISFSYSKSRLML